ncbi:MAG: J domain-containing protein [Campylobacteraceae bacterium]|nr:J domain-containing protein [Campylobacteraceae bacterium]
MRLRINTNATVIELCEQSVWYEEITNKLQKTFQKTFWASHCLINLPIKGEEEKRRFFLLEIYRICSKLAHKHDSDFLKRLLASSHKPIKIQPTNSTHPTKYALLEYTVKEKILTIKLEKEETFLFWHSVHRFKAHKITHDFFKKRISFHLPTASLKKELFEFLETKIFLGYSLAHKYNYNNLNSFFLFSQSSHNPLEAHYKTLGIKVGTNIEMIRMRYLSLAKTHHPDLASEEEADTYTRKFQQIQEAYHAIKSEIKSAS